MTYQALYRTYRPEKLAEMVGQEEAVSLIQGQLDNNEITHAYLFSGPRGVGKTSIARILASNLNNIESIDSSLDIIELDGASNRGIDEIKIRTRLNKSNKMSIDQLDSFMVTHYMIFIFC